MNRRLRCFIRSLSALVLSFVFLSRAFPQNAPASGSKDQCVECHRILSPALVMEWERSRHAQGGIACVDCHAAAKNDTDGWMHYGSLVAALVTPKDCARCHEQEYE